MTLRTALVIEGSAEGARRAAQDTVKSIGEIRKAAGDASGQTSAIAGHLEKASREAAGTTAGFRELPPVLAEAATKFDDLGQKADTAGGRFSAARSAIMGFASGIVGGAALGAVAGVMDAAVSSIISYAANAISKTDEINAALEGHVKLIRSIKGAYAEAEGGASSYGRNSVAVLRFNAQQDVGRLSDAYRSSLPDGGFFNAGIFEQGSGGYTSAQLGPYAEAVQNFRTAVRAGRADVIAFRNEIAAIGAEQPEDSRFRRMAETMLEDTERAAEALEALRRAEDALKAIAGDTDAAVRALGGAADKYDALGSAAGTAGSNIPETTAAIRNSGLAAEEAAGRIAAYQAALAGSGHTTSPVPSPARASATPRPFATGGVVDRPQLFGFAGGELGLMGEAGPEAILPLASGKVRAKTAAGGEIPLALTRMADGVLGVALPHAFAMGGSFGDTSTRSVFLGADGGFRLFDDLTDDIGLLRGALSGFVAGLRQGETALGALGSVIARLSERVLDRAIGALDTALFGRAGASGLFSFGASQLDRAASGLITGLFHQGGDVGASPSATRLVSPLLFAGAPRFHRGGLIGATGTHGSEIPLIAQVGEEIGWPQDLARKYAGGGQVTNFYISTPDVKSFSESRASLARSAARLSARAGRHV